MIARYLLSRSITSAARVFADSTPDRFLALPLVGATAFWRHMAFRCADTSTPDSFAAAAAEPCPRRTAVIAVVPIAVALIGLALIMFGGATARDPASAIGAAKQVDPIATGAIPERDRAYDLMMLDR